MSSCPDGLPARLPPYDLAAVTRPPGTSAAREAPLRDPRLAGLPADRMLDELLVRLSAAMGADIAQFLLVEDGRLRVLASVGVPEERAAAVSVAVGEGFAGTVAATGAPAVLTDGETLGSFATAWAVDGVKALVAVPLLVDGAVIGVCLAGTRSERQFSDEDISLLSAAAERAAWVARHGVLLAAEQHARKAAEASAARLASLQRLTAALAEVHDSSVMTDLIVTEATSALGAVRVMLSLYDATTNTLRTTRSFGVQAELDEQYAEFPCEPGLPAADALLERAPVLITDVATRNERYPALATMNSEEHALVCLPLVVANRPIGSLALSFAGRQAFDDNDISFLTALADQCAHALERARLLGLEANNRLRLELLAEAGRIFSAPLDVRLTSAQFSRLVVGRIGDAVTVHLREPDGSYTLAAAEHVDAEQAIAQRRATDELPAHITAVYDHIINEAKPVLINNVPADAFAASIVDDEVRAVIARRPPQSNIVLPLIAGGHGLGVLNVTTVADGHPALTEDDVEQLDELAGRLALALDGARLLRQQTEIAHTLQRSLLPATLPHVPGAEVAVRYLAGAEGVDVGGDFYDVIPLPSGRIGLVVGDVMGRGVRAAAVMGQLRAAVRAYSLEGHPPAALLARLDRLVGTLEEGLLVTAIYAEWDPGRNHILCACAGHLPPLLRLPGQEPSFVEVDPGVPLGVGSQSYVEAELTLPPGSLLLAFTDGLVERPDLSVDEGMSRLAAALRSSTSAMGACEAALAELRPRDSEVVKGDDIALLALLTHPSSSEPQHLPDRDDGQSMELPADTSSPARARMFVAELLTGWEMVEVLDAATLLTSELVTNAVRHAGTGLRLSVNRVGERGVRVAVTDHAPGVGVRMRQSLHDAEGGRGLYLVEHLSSGWGSIADDNRKTVWFELRA